MSEPTVRRVVIIGFGTRRLHRRHLCGAGAAAAAVDRRPAAGRPADHHHRRGELSGLRRRDPGPVADGADARPGRARRHRVHGGHRHRRRPVAAAVPPTLDSGKTVLAETLIIATGAQAKWLGLDTEKKFQGFGVSACATLRRLLLPAEGGDRGRRRQHRGRGGPLPHQLRLQGHRRAPPRRVPRRDASCRSGCSPIPRSRWCGTRPSTRCWRLPIPLGVTGVKLKNLKTGAVTERAVDGVFVAIGHAPASELFKGQLEMDGSGYLKVKAGTVSTAVPGVFAAGDVSRRHLPPGRHRRRAWAAWPRSRPPACWPRKTTPAPTTRSPTPRPKRSGSGRAIQRLLHSLYLICPVYTGWVIPILRPLGGVSLSFRVVPPRHVPHSAAGGAIPPATPTPHKPTQPHKHPRYQMSRGESFFPYSRSFDLT